MKNMEKEQSETISTSGAILNTKRPELNSHGNTCCWEFPLKIGDHDV
jgi:hypothetical protein